MKSTSHIPESVIPRIFGGKLAVAYIAAALAVPASLLAASDSAGTDPGPDLGTLSLEQLMQIEIPTVYGASKHDQKITVAPASVSLVTAEDIQKHGYRTLAEALNSLPGVYTSNDRNYEYLGVRGFLRPGDYNSRVLLLVDGHRMNDNIYDAFFVGDDATIDIDLVDRIEFIPGPGSSIYGNNAFLGVINIRTKRAAQVNGAEASVSGGTFDTYSGRFTLGKVFSNDLELLVSGSLYQSSGDDSLYYPEFDDGSPHGGVARDMDDEQAYKVFTSLRYHDLTLSGAFSSRTKRIPTASYETVFNDNRAETRDIRAYLDLKYERDLTDDSRLMARVYYDRLEYDGTYPGYSGVPDPAIILNKDESGGDWVGAEAQYNHQLFDVHTVIVGAEYRENIRQFQGNREQETGVVYLDDSHSSRHGGVFGQAEVALDSTLRLDAGLRYDHYSAYGGSLNPRAGLIYTPWESSTFKFLYGRAFRTPNDYETDYYAGVDGYSGNPDLEPETIDTYELVWEQQLGRQHRVRLSGYLYEIDGLITETCNPATGTIYYDNLERVHAKGLEFFWEGLFEYGIRVNGSYSIQHAEDDSGAELSNSPEHLAKLRITAPIYREKVFAGLEYQYRGEVRTITGGTAGDFMIVNLTLFGHELLPGLDLSASLYNLFDEDYSVPGASFHLQETIAQDGRQFRFKLTYRF